MEIVDRLNEAEIADALAGKTADERILECVGCGAEFAAWKDLGGRLRQDLECRADMPGYFWTRQQARIRERLAQRTVSAGWAAAAVLVLILLAFGMIRQGAVPKTEMAGATTMAAMARIAPVNSDDDALLEGIHNSLQRDVPASLAPAAVLLDEVASASKQAQKVKEN